LTDRWEARLTDSMIAVGTDQREPWLFQGHTIILFSDQARASAFCSQPGFPAEGKSFRIMTGYEDLRARLQEFKSIGARCVCIDPPPGNGVSSPAAGIDEVINDVQRVLDGWEEICLRCGLRPMECRCG
jgi:hypothetical protein